MGFTIKFLNFCKVNIFTGGLHPQITPKKVERVFFEFLPFTTMKLCLYGVMVSYSANNAHDVQNNLEKLFPTDCQRFCNAKAFYLKQRFQTV